MSAASIRLERARPPGRAAGASPPAPSPSPGATASPGWDSLPQILTAYELAALVRISYWALLERIRVESIQIASGYKPAPANPIPVRRLGRRLRFDRDEIRAWFGREGMGC